MSAHITTLFIIRGLPGSGKSTLGRSIEFRSGEVPDCLSADDYFVGTDGVYRFSPSGLPAAHAECQAAVRSDLAHGSSVCVANTFTQRWEMEPYLRMAAEFGARVVVIDCFDAGMSDEELAAKNVHGVPVAGIAAMRSRWEHDWRAGEQRAPWVLFRH